MSEEKTKKEGELDEEQLDEASGGVLGIQDLGVAKAPLSTQIAPAQKSPAELQIPGTGKGGVMGVRG